MKWIEIRSDKDLPDVGEDVLTWDSSKIFNPKWSHNRLQDHGWMKNGTITAFMRIDDYIDYLTIENMPF